MQLRQNLVGPVLVIAGLMGVSVLLRVVARSDSWRAVLGGLLACLALVVALPYAARIHRSIILREGVLVFEGILRRKTIRLEAIGLLSVSAQGPDPQLRVIDVSGELVWRVHLAYWPGDLEQRLRSAGSMGKPLSYRPRR